ncbi:TetR/AcrR family transcriptional regulator [Rhodovastum atsumiense]|uniref:TetR/AcrR family transcriptional regulator n=1 Tax=Rhodovastum atsumiense TaxID=504468 RepID=A0A5M6IQ98_9PROT|nr:TetR/AcrR family transcriptional regulator [Rhodovastum atsumiense]KAA5609738.1 TetR/AcrR family transcriptional regulator [Rhodovastum atsumiense]CAH2604510.1 TetR/AcrR family transcriptional regulator [Rhodovastum atsumiense]
MRVSREQAAENRERILVAAARLFRERGFSGIGVDALTEAAGLTHGSVYSQFGSKEQLAAEAVARAFTLSGEAWASLFSGEEHPADLKKIVQRYLSQRHRDAPGSGCALAALGGEAARQGAPVREAFTAGVRRMAARLAPLQPGPSKAAREDAALATMASLVGALVLARAVDDPALSDRILAATRQRLDAEG